jgi:hypothetical protein
VPKVDTQKALAQMQQDAAAKEPVKKAARWSFRKPKEKTQPVVVVVPTPEVTVTPTIVRLPTPAKPVKKQAVAKKQEVLVEQKIEVSERVTDVSSEFKALIQHPDWRFKVRYDEKTSELVVTFRMTRASLDALIATPEGKPYAQVLEGLFSQL